MLQLNPLLSDGCIPLTKALRVRVVSEVPINKDDPGYVLADLVALSPRSGYVVADLPLNEGDNISLLVSAGQYGLVSDISFVAGVNCLYEDDDGRRGFVFGTMGRGTAAEDALGSLFSAVVVRDTSKIRPLLGVLPQRVPVLLEIAGQYLEAAASEITTEGALLQVPTNVASEQVCHVELFEGVDIVPVRVAGVVSYSTPRRDEIGVSYETKILWRTPLRDVQGAGLGIYLALLTHRDAENIEGNLENQFVPLPAGGIPGEDLGDSEQGLLDYAPPLPRAEVSSPRAAEEVSTPRRSHSLYRVLFWCLWGGIMSGAAFWFLTPANEEIYEELAIVAREPLPGELAAGSEAREQANAVVRQANERFSTRATGEVAVSFSLATPPAQVDVFTPEIAGDSLGEDRVQAGRQYLDGIATKIASEQDPRERKRLQAQYDVGASLLDAMEHSVPRSQP